jgi:hypothetical protein
MNPNVSVSYFRTGFITYNRPFLQWQLLAVVNKRFDPNALRAFFRCFSHVLSLQPFRRRRRVGSA